MSIHEDIKQACLNWVMSTLGFSDRKKVILEHEWDAPRPDKPYLSLRLQQTGRVQFNESIHGTKNGNASHKTHGGRRGQLTVQGYGTGDGVAVDWIEDLQSSLHNPLVRDQINDAGLTIERLEGGLNDVTQLVGDRYEERYGAEFQIRYRVVNDEVETYPAVDVVALDFDLEDPAEGDTIDASISIDT
jgi:hypothetical protein